MIGKYTLTRCLRLMGLKKRYPIKKLLISLKRKRVNPSIQKTSDYSKTHSKQVKVIQLIQAYRNRGHQKAQLDPLGLKPVRHCDDLDLDFHDLDESNLSDTFETDTLMIGKESATLSEIIEALEAIYCGTLGIEYNYVSSLAERTWFQKRLEPNLGKLNFNQDEQKYILKRLSSAEGLAKFLSSRYPGMKRFGIDGAESLIPWLIV